jgi:hypothetical protein
VSGARERVLPAHATAFHLVRVDGLNVDEPVLDDAGKTQSVAEVGPSDGEFHCGCTAFSR